MAKVKAAPSELKKFLELIKRILVLSVAAYGLWFEMPYETLLIRLAILWGILSLSTNLIEVLFQYLSMKAKTVVIRHPHMSSDKNTAAVISTIPNK